MKLLLDEMRPRPLRRDLIGHDALTVTQAGWSGTRNGALLALAERQFDAFITMDGSIEFQQSMQRFELCYIIVHAIDNKLETLRPLVPAILQALNHIKPREVIHVGNGR